MSTATTAATGSPRDVRVPVPVPVLSVPAGDVYTRPEEWLEYAQTIVKVAEEQTGAAKRKRDDKERDQKRRYNFFACECDRDLVDALVVAPGDERGEKHIVCGFCCPKCPRCHNPALDLERRRDDWKGNVCYDCYDDNNQQADSAGEEESESESESESGSESESKSDNDKEEEEEEDA